MKIKILKKNKNNFNCDFEKIYIGRPSLLSNPFPTKVSKFSNLIYSHTDSMKMFYKYLLKNVEDNKNNDIKKTIFDLSLKDNIVLECFCINKDFDINDFKNFSINNVKCHGEIIAYFIFKIKNL